VPVLEFDNQQVYEETINKLNEMTAEEIEAYFESIGFEGAYTLLSRADNELEEIFDIEDSVAFENRLQEYKIKYGDIFKFNDIDLYDASPYLPFTDDNAALIGNVYGYVVVDSTLIEPADTIPTFEVDDYETDNQGALTRIAYGIIQPRFKAYKNASLTIKNGKYKSTMTLGWIIESNTLAIDFVTKKQAFLHKKTVSATHSVRLIIDSANYYNNKMVRCPSKARYVDLNLPLQVVGKTFTAAFIDFKSSCGNATGTLTNIKIY
jgi:hypothetical protein